MRLVQCFVTQYKDFLEQEIVVDRQMFFIEEKEIDEKVKDMMLPETHHSRIQIGLTMYNVYKQNK